MNEPDILADKCAEILYRILVEIRNLSGQPGNEKLIFELADLAHNIPRFIVGRDDFIATWLRDGLIDHARRFRPQTAPEQWGLVQIFDMPADEFRAVFRPAVTEPEPLTAAQ